MGAEYLSKTREARLGARYLENAKGAVVMAGLAKEGDEDVDALAADLMASVATKFTRNV